MKKFKTAVIGSGFIGVAHIEALRRLGNVEVIALCDMFNVERKAKENHIELAYTDYKKMIDENDLDFVHICTPNNTHFEIAKYALERNVNVVLEKPMTFTVEEAVELVKLAKEKNLINAVNFHNRLYPANIFIKDYIRENNIGDVFSINGNYLQDWLLFDTDYSWRLNTKESGSTRAVADIGSHWMDLVEYLTGLKIVEVFAEFKTVYPQRKKAIGEIKTFSVNEVTEYELKTIDTEDIAMVMYRFENGAIGNVTISQMAAGKKNNLEVFISGTKASVSWGLDDLENVHIGYRDKPSLIMTKDYGLMTVAKNAIDFPAGHTEGFPDAIKQVFKQVYSQPQDKHYAQFEDGLRQMILCEKISESAKKSQWIKI